MPQPRNDPRETRRAPPLWWALPLVVVVSVLTVLWLRPRPGETGSEAGHAAPRSEPPVSPGVARVRDAASDAGVGAAREVPIIPGSSASGAAEPPSVVPSPDDDDPGPGDEFIARYGGRSGRLSPHTEPGDAHAVSPQRSHMAAPNVIAWAPSGVQAPMGADVPLYAMVVDEDAERVSARSVEVTFFRANPSDGITLAMGAAARGEAHDWQVVYTPTADAHPPAADGSPARVQWTVRATGEYQGERYTRSATGFFLVSDPGARLQTQDAHATREGSDLLVRVPVRIARPGAYWGYAELWGGPEGLTPIAFARERVEFDSPGERSFEFLFGGAVIRARAVDGPYVVRNMRFMQVDSIPPHEQPVADRVLTTPAWPASSFE